MTPPRVLVIGMDTLQPEPPPGAYTSEEMERVRRDELVRASCRTCLAMLSDVAALPVQAGDPPELGEAVVLLRKVAGL